MKFYAVCTQVVVSGLPSYMIGWHFVLSLYPVALSKD